MSGARAEEIPYRDLTGREYEFQSKLLEISESDPCTNELAAMMQGMTPHDIYQIGYAQCFNRVWIAFKEYVK